MKIEIVEFYPIKDKKYIGTIHIYLIDCNMDIRGIKVFKIKNGYYFQMPGEYARDENDKIIFYPYISFIEEKDKKEVIFQLIKFGTKYINDYLKENKNG